MKGEWGKYQLVSVQSLWVSALAGWCFFFFVCIPVFFELVCRYLSNLQGYIIETYFRPHLIMDFALIFKVSIGQMVSALHQTYMSFFFFFFLSWYLMNCLKDVQGYVTRTVFTAEYILVILPSFSRLLQKENCQIYVVSCVNRWQNFIRLAEIKHVTSFRAD